MVGWQIPRTVAYSGFRGYLRYHAKNRSIRPVTFTLPLFPEASIQFTPVAMTLGVISIFTVHGWRSNKRISNVWQRTVAYPMGFVTVAIYAGSTLAYQGAVVQMITNGLSGAALIIISGQLYERTQTRDMRMMGGLWKRIKWLPGMSLFLLRQR